MNMAEVPGNFWGFEWRWIWSRSQSQWGTAEGDRGMLASVTALRWWWSALLLMGCSVSPPAAPATPPFPSITPLGRPVLASSTAASTLRPVPRVDPNERLRSILCGTRQQCSWGKNLGELTLDNGETRAVSTLVVKGEILHEGDEDKVGCDSEEHWLVALFAPDEVRMKQHRNPRPVPNGTK